MTPGRVTAGTAAEQGRTKRCTGGSTLAVRLLLVLAVVFATVPAGVSAAAGSGGTAPVASAADAAATTGASPLTVRVERTDGALVYHVRVRAPAGAERVRLTGAFGLHAVTATDGLTATDRGYRLREGRESGTLVARFDLETPRRTPLGRVGTDGTFQAGEDWAFAPSPRFRLSWTDAGMGERSSVALGAGAALRGDASVAVGDRYLFVGPHTVHERSVEGRTVRLVVPAAATPELAPDAAFGTMRETAATLGTGASRPVTAFVLPRAARAGAAASGTDLWMNAAAGRTTLAHEFTHVSLSLRTTSATRWLGEAAAEYVALRVTGRADPRDSLAHRTVDPTATLTDPSTWTDGRAPYGKGVAVLHELDRRVQATTHGVHGVLDVLRRLDARGGRLTAAALAATVTAVGDESIAEWLEAETSEATSRADDPTATDPTTAGLGSSVSVVGLSALLSALGALCVLVWVPATAAYRVARSLRRATRRTAG